jgi:hypothetical protein
MTPCPILLVKHGDDRGSVSDGIADGPAAGLFVLITARSACAPDCGGARLRGYATDTRRGRWRGQQDVNRVDGVADRPGSRRRSGPATSQGRRQPTRIPDEPDIHLRPPQAAANITRRPAFRAFDGTELAYHVRGDGDGAPLICLPGGPMRASAYLGDLGGLSGAIG